MINALSYIIIKGNIKYLLTTKIIKHKKMTNYQHFS